ncbi:MAG TPA: UDP-N-acetylmuramate dehydrogenase [Burkholderiales bacterium]|nr:UDP-N-acetylmuramate dehydrogenase [Burkholderiales bacterium]
MNMADLLQLRGLRGELLRDEPMARHVSWRAGGKAERFFVPADLEDLQLFMRSVAPAEPLLFAGLGSNLLVRDGGFRGTVIALHTAKLHPDLVEGRIHALAGVAAPKVARFAARHGLAGAEFLAGIPGTVGGALAMNAGCYGGETWNIVDSVQTIDRQGVLHVRLPREFEIGYRHCQPRMAREEWFVGAAFRLAAGDGEASRARIKAFLEKRIATQPLNLPNAGSVFRNPPGDHAARLIEACGLKGLVRGGARVSEKHANFIVNPDGAASAADIEALILDVQRRVRDMQGVQLVPEVRIVGEAA